MKSYSKIVVTTLISLIVLFTITVLVLSYFDKIVPDALIYSFYGATSGELALSAMIKTSKIKGERQIEIGEQDDRY